MLYRYFIKVSFDGTNYNGWQVQKNSSKTIQQKINDGLSCLLNEKIKVTGCCRTDAGVHALALFAHFDTQKNLSVSLSEKKQWIYKFNKMLPTDISVNEIFSVRKDAHARYDAYSRTYRYLIHQKRNPFLVNRSYYYYSKLDVSLMNKGAALLKKYKDFSAFSKLNVQTKSNYCTIFSARWKKDKDMLLFEICADRFLRGMVRMIVGTMILLGRNKITIDDFKRIIENRDVRNARALVPASGLYLINVKYPKDIFLE